MRLFGGINLAARDWSQVGRLILNQGRWEDRRLLDSALLAQCFQGNAVNPICGLSFWLPFHDGGLNDHRKPNANSKLLAEPGAPEIIKAAGVGGQKMCAIPSLNMVIVRQSIRRGKRPGRGRGLHGLPLSSQHPAGLWIRRRK